MNKFSQAGTTDGSEVKIPLKRGIPEELNSIRVEQNSLLDYNKTNKIEFSSLLKGFFYSRKNISTKTFKCDPVLNVHLRVQTGTELKRIWEWKSFPHSPNTSMDGCGNFVAFHGKRSLAVDSVEQL